MPAPQTRTCHAQAYRHRLDPHHRGRTDRHRTGLRVRLFRHAGRQGAEGGGLPRHPGQLEPGDDHDGSRIWRTPPMSSRSRRRSSPRSSRRKSRTRCCRRWAGRRPSTPPWRCEAAGVLDKHGVEMIGAKADAIDKAEDRERFREAMTAIGLETPRSRMAHSMGEALEALEAIGLPAIIRPSFTLGGTGGGIAYNRSEFIDIIERGLDASPTIAGPCRGKRARAGRSTRWRSSATRRTTPSSSARSRTSTRWASTPATRSPSRRR